MRTLRSLSLIAIITAAGCGGGLEQYPTVTTSGVVMCNGAPVENVRVRFAPISKKGSVEGGKSGTGITNADGMFVISTYGEEDGAVIGSHNVLVSPPNPESFPDFTCDCQTNGNKPVMQVEVAENDANIFTIEMPPKVRESQPSINPETLEDIQTKD